MRESAELISDNPEKSRQGPYTCTQCTEDAMHVLTRAYSVIESLKLGRASGISRLLFISPAFSMSDHPSRSMPRQQDLISLAVCA